MEITYKPSGLFKQLFFFINGKRVAIVKQLDHHGTLQIEWDYDDDSDAPTRLAVMRRTATSKVLRTLHELWGSV